MLKLYTKAKIALNAKRDRGVTAAEYGLILALVAVAIIVAVTTLGGSISDKFTQVADTINKAG